MIQSMQNPLVSIIICCYNRAHILPEALASVFKQTYEPVEILVMDDGSTDNTRKVVKSYGDKICYYRQENQGVARARMNACRLAKGAFIAFQDDDDLMPDDRIHNLYQAFIRYPSAVLAVGDWVAIDKNGSTTGKRWLPEGTLSEGPPVLIDNGYEAVLWPKIPATPHTTLFRKVDGERIHWFDSRFRYAAEDKDFFARLAKLGPVVYIPKVVSYYRRGHASLTQETIVKETQKILLFEKHFKLLTSNQTKLLKRLRFRTLLSLLRIERARDSGKMPTESVPVHYLKNGKALLGVRERLIYFGTTKIKMPLSKIFHKLKWLFK